MPPGEGDCGSRTDGRSEGVAAAAVLLSRRREDDDEVPRGVNRSCESPCPAERDALRIRSATALLQDCDCPDHRFLRPLPPLLCACAHHTKTGDDLVDALARLVHLPDDTVKVWRPADLEQPR